MRYSVWIAVATARLFFKSDEAHIRALAIESGNLIAGSDGSGLVYRISPTGEAFVLYSAPKKEITALAIEGTETFTQLARARNAVRARHRPRVRSTRLAPVRLPR